MLVVVWFLLAGCAAAPDAAPLGVGSGRFAMPAPAGVDGEVRVFYHRPPNFHPDGPIVIVMHGVDRNADAYRDTWRPLAERYGALVLAPEFPRHRFPNAWQYNHGNVFADGTWNPPEAWTFSLIERAFDEARARAGASRDRYVLFGHSAGGQFVHRFNTFIAGHRAEALIAANAGWYTFADRAAGYPYGLRDAPVDDVHLARAFARPLVVLLGEEDIDMHDRNLRQSAGAMAQGPHRLARGFAYVAAARAEAARLGVPFAWRIVTVPGAGHRRAPMSEAAARLLFE